MNSAVCVPGTRICVAGGKYVAGAGTYTRHGYIFSSLAGRLEINKQADNEKATVEVRHPFSQCVIPTPGSVVTCRITSLTQRFCKCHIICVEDTDLKEPFHGIIRREDVRSFDKDQVEMVKSFRPGDIVLAKVVSLGDALSYVLSTAENDLGVVIALGPAGVPMVPIGWTEMQCPKTNVKEFRKVANVKPPAKSDPEPPNVSEIN